jgi:hypothetical protein
MTDDESAKNERGLVSRPVPEKDQDYKGQVESPYSVEELLKDSGKPFDHELFRARLRELKDEVVDDGGVVLIPMTFGQPSPDEAIINDTELVLSYEPNSLFTYSRNTLRAPKKHVERLGPLIIDDFTTEPDPMTEDDVRKRVEMVQNFEPLAFPAQPNRLNQMNGITVMTDAEGKMKISLNCPYPIMPSPESPVRGDSTLPVPGNDHLATRLYYAAVLHEMGFDADFIYRAVGTPQPIPVSDENGLSRTYKPDDQKVLSFLGSIPALRGNRTFDAQTYTSQWVQSEALPYSQEEVWQTVITTARFGGNGNVIFGVRPSKVKQQ